jgi:hypothetical protein
MDFPRLQNGESILRKTSSISIKAKPYKAYITTQRLIVVDDRSQPPLQKEIQLSQVTSIEPGENEAVEPTLQIGVVTPEGAVRTMILTFSQNLGEYRIQERDEWVRELQLQLDSIAARSAAKSEPEVQAEVNIRGDISREILDVEGHEHYIDEITGVRVKSQQYRVHLTNSRLILLDENQLPPAPKYVDIDQIVSAEGGASPRNEPTLVIGVGTEGTTRKMILSFPQQIGEVRSGERDRFLASLRSLLSLPEPSPPANTPTLTPAPVTAPPGISESKSFTYCPQCGVQIFMDSKFCYSCGQQLTVQGSWIVPDAGHPEPVPPASREVRAKRTKPRRERVKRVRKKKFSIGHFSVIGKFVRFIIAPSEGFMVSKGDSLGEASLYLLMILAVFSVANSAVISYIGSIADPLRYPILADIGAGGAAGIFILAIELIIFGLLAILAISCLYHIGVILIGGKHHFSDTMRAAIYGTTPFAVIGLIPLAGLIAAPIWTFFLQIIGIREYQDLSTGGALIAMIIGIGLGCILILILEGIGVSIARFL